MNNDKRLIEDYLPIEAISAEASREKSVRKGHISTLHLWWARRPLVACRAAVYGALVPASRFVPQNGPDNKKASLGRANAAKFVAELCKYPGNPRAIAQAQEHILEAHAHRLTDELVEAGRSGQWPAWVGEFKWPKDKSTVTRTDIEAGRAPRPRVLDMFAGGGAIPLEALRLGCEAYALDLNPVAHVIELCTLVYPQKYGKPDPNARGMTGPKNARGETTWGGLAEEVRYWGKWVLEKAKAELGDLYPLIPDPAFDHRRTERQAAMREVGPDYVPAGYLVPVAYLWTRTVQCKNPECRATVPLVRQTWLCKKAGRYVAMRMVPNSETRRVRFQVVESSSEQGLGFDPAGFSRGGNATCPFCGTVADIDYVKDEGWAGRMGEQLMTVACARPGDRTKLYLSPKDLPIAPIQTGGQLGVRLTSLCTRTGLTVPDEPIANQPRDSRDNTLGITVRPYGLRTWGDVFTTRQVLCLLAFAAAVRQAGAHAGDIGVSSERGKAVSVVLAMALDKLADLNCSLTTWKTDAELCVHAFGRQALPMVWDFAEQVPYSGIGGSWQSQVGRSVEGLDDCWQAFDRASVTRGSATQLASPDETVDAIVTDPPYYDNVPYADISDFFYVWLKRTVGHLYPEHFAAQGTPKKAEAVADATRHGGSKVNARRAYEEMMAQAFREAQRVLKPGGELVVVYAHKTTLGWATLVDALRLAGFTVVEAWPLDTEMKSRLRGMDSSALASSIFLVARKRGADGTGSYEADVRPELERIVRQRVGELWEMGISGADLVIACVGAGLRAFTRHARVEYANGDEVPAERFLAEVETVVLESILARLSHEVGEESGGYHLAGVDGITRFYVLWRYTYRWTDLDAGEAIVFANGTHVELDGQGSLSSGTGALVEKKKAQYHLRDYRERGANDRLGLPDGRTGQTAPLVDVLHRTLWLLENRPRELTEFLSQSGVSREALRLVAQVLAGPALKGGELPGVSPAAELALLQRLTANWRSVIEDAAFTPPERKARRDGQLAMDLGGKE